MLDETREGLRWLLLVVFAWSLAGCENTNDADGSVCESGRQVACACPGGGADGAQVCNELGTGWDVCDCDEGAAAGSGDDAGGGTSADSDDESDTELEQDNGSGSDSDTDTGYDIDPDTEGTDTDTDSDTGQDSPSEMTEGFLWVDGNQLRDVHGNLTRLTGINWFGFETETMLPHGLWQRDHYGMLSQVVELGFNSIRLPFSNAMLAATQAVNTVDAELMGMSPLEAMDTIIATAGELGLKVMLDNHSRASDGYLDEALWYTDAVDEDAWIADWVMLAERYAGNTAVVAMDLNNEPHGEATWGTGNSQTDWNSAAERCAEAIHQVNPDVLIVVEGVQTVDGDSYWWGGNLAGVRSHPLTITLSDKLVYSAHEYGPEVYEQPWFDDADFPENMRAIWDDHFGFVMSEELGHVLIGEFGIRDQDGSAGKAALWFEAFIDYMGAEYSWTYWSLNPNSFDTGGVLQDDWVGVHAWKLEALRPFMAPMIGAGAD